MGINSSYVLSKGVAYKGNAAAFRNRPVNPADPFNPMDFGPVPTDERHRFVFSGVFDLPWRISLAPVFQAASARPYDGIEGTDVLGVGSGRGNFSVITLDSSPTDLLGTKGFTASQLRTCLAAGTCHSIGFDALRGDPFVQMDLRASKSFRFGDRMDLRLMSQFFDLFNRANFGNNFGANIRSGTFRKPIGFITPSGVIVPKSFRAEFGAEFRF